jgi:hypothetical protein
VKATSLADAVALIDQLVGERDRARDMAAHLLEEAMSAGPAVACKTCGLPLRGAGVLSAVLFGMHHAGHVVEFSRQAGGGL